ncbi:MAG: RDD family protein [Planctomycetaceae bacterium]
MRELSTELADPAAPLTLQLRIETPENVVLNYQLAGPAPRLLAYLIDFGLRVASMGGLCVALTPLAALFPGSAVGFWFVAWFLNSWGYYAISEGFFKGKTIGKHALGLRVIHEKGHPITFWPAVLRNLVRAADGLPYFLHGIGFVSTLLTRNFQRLGDLAARTVVIAERVVVLPTEPVILERIQPLSRDELGSYVPPAEMLTAIDHFLGRRYVLSHDRGHEIASLLAKPLARRLNYRGDPNLVTQYPMAFLARVYVTFLRRPDEADVEARELRPRTAAAGAAR